MSDAGGGVAYIDTSALLKLVVREAESEALDRERSTWRGLATSTITGIELRRAIGRARAAGRESVAAEGAVGVLLDVVAEIPLTGRVRATAGALEPVELRAPSTRSTWHLRSPSARTSAPS